MGLLSRLIREMLAVGKIGRHIYIHIYIYILCGYIEIYTNIYIYMLIYIHVKTLKVVEDK